MLRSIFYCSSESLLTPKTVHSTVTFSMMLLCGVIKTR